MNSNVFATMLLAAVLCLMEAASFAQEVKAQPAPQPQPDHIISAYRVDFSVNELDEGKKINTRQYSLNLNADDANEVKVGTRVPVEIKQGEFQYVDVGTRIWSRLKERESGLLLEVRSEISNFAIPEQANRSNSMPLLRQFQINASTVVLPGKPIVVGSVDDPNSRHEFQLEVVATKLK
jgi:hypothetical protein